VNGGQARMRVVLIGEGDGDAIRVQSGLAANESVVTTNQSQLFDGATVKTL